MEKIRELTAQETQGVSGGMLLCGGFGPLIIQAIANAVRAKSQPTDKK